MKNQEIEETKTESKSRELLSLLSGLNALKEYQEDLEKEVILNDEGRSDNGKRSKGYYQCRVINAKTLLSVHISEYRDRIKAFHEGVAK